MNNLKVLNSKICIVTAQDYYQKSVVTCNISKYCLVFKIKKKIIWTF